MLTTGELVSGSDESIFQEQKDFLPIWTFPHSIWQHILFLLSSSSSSSLSKSFLCFTCFACFPRAQKTDKSRWFAGLLAPSGNLHAMCVCVRVCVSLSCCCFFFSSIFLSCSFSSPAVKNSRCRFDANLVVTTAYLTSRRRRRLSALKFSFDAAALTAHERLGATTCWWCEKLGMLLGTAGLARLRRRRRISKDYHFLFDSVRPSVDHSFQRRRS